MVWKSPYVEKSWGGRWGLGSEQPFNYKTALVEALPYLLSNLLFKQGHVEIGVDWHSLGKKHKPAGPIVQDSL